LDVAALSSAAFFRDAATKHYVLRRNSPESEPDELRDVVKKSATFD
jgi:hypothetical protein